MTFQVREAFRLGKYDDEDRCEDVIHESDAFVAVIDGATSFGTPAGKSPGRIMADLIDDALHRTPAVADFKTAIRAINTHVRTSLGYADSDDVLRRGARPTAAALILSRTRQEVWAVGDGWLMCDSKTEKIEIPFDEPCVFLRCAMVDARRRAGVAPEELLRDTNDIEAILPFIRLQPAIQNNPEAGRFAFGVIDGADGCLPFIRTFDLSATREVVMASDGYPDLRPTLFETEALLADVIRRDPLMIDLYPQVKAVRPGQVSYDDRAYVRLVRT